MPGGDQHPDHNVLAGENFIASVYMSILNNEEPWKKTLLLLVYDEHGGVYDHVEPPACTPGEFQEAATGFEFHRLGVRVPAIAISPWIPEGTIVNRRAFDHAPILAAVAKRLIGVFPDRSPRESPADTFLDLLSCRRRGRTTSASPQEIREAPSVSAFRKSRWSKTPPLTLSRECRVCYPLLERWEGTSMRNSFILGGGARPPLF
jgi:hypothetical protein